jgi:hypothetical protein
LLPYLAAGGAGTAAAREQELALTYDPAARTLIAGTGDAPMTITLKAS